MATPEGRHVLKAPDDVTRAHGAKEEHIQREGVASWTLAAVQVGQLCVMGGCSSLRHPHPMLRSRCSTGIERFDRRSRTLLAGYPKPPVGASLADRVSPDLVGSRGASRERDPFTAATTAHLDHVWLVQGETLRRPAGYWHFPNAQHSGDATTHEKSFTVRCPRELRP